MPQNNKTRKIEKIEKFLLAVGMIDSKGRLRDDNSNIDTLLERLQEQAVMDGVQAVLATKRIGMDRKLNAVNEMLQIDEGVLPIGVKVVDGKECHDEDKSADIWSYICKVARRDDYDVYKYCNYVKEKQDGKRK